MLRALFALTLIANALADSLPHFGGRIVGGVAIEITKVPYQVSVQLYGGHWCGGSLIDKSLVLTATHCFYGEVTSPRQIKVRVGSTLSNQGGQLIRVKSLIAHPDYDDDLTTNDITLLRLSRDVILSDSVKWIPLALKEEAPGTPAYISGWGQTSEHNYTLPIHLRGVEIALISREECRSRYSEDEIFDYNVCAFSKNKDSCQGDSGGPLVSNGKLLGIVSWGDGCAKRKYPGVYTSVPAFIDWINKTAKII